MNTKQWFYGSMMALLIFGCAVTSVMAQENEPASEEQIQQEVEQHQKEVEKQKKEIEKHKQEVEKHEKEIEKQARELEKQLEKLNKLSEINLEKGMKQLEKGMRHLDMISRLDALHSLHNLQNLQIPPVPPVPAIPMPDIMNPEKMLKEFQGKTVTKTESKTFASNANTSLVVESSFSSVHITPATIESAITVNVERLGGGSTTTIAEEMADRFSVNMKEENNQVIVVVKMDGKENQNNNQTLMHCFLNITVPASIPIDVSNEFGGVRYEGLEGGIDSNNKFGSTSILGTKGSLDINSSYGALSIDGHEGDADLNSEFGSSSIKNINGNIDFNNSYGSSEVSLTGSEAQADINFSFGNGTVHLPKSFNGSIDADSSFGNIIIAGNSVSGKLEGEMTGSKESAGVILKNVEANKDMFNQSIECTVGEGEGSVDVNADYSTIYIHFDL